jgi:thiamine-monophosphate kinase
MIAPGERAALVARYRLPEPRCELGKRLIGLASAAIDISDGLVADLGHVCRASRLGARIEADAVPLSPAARAACGAEPELLKRALSGGDDYELLITAAPGAAERLGEAAGDADIALNRIGAIVGEPGVRVFAAGGGEIEFASAGYTHF